MQTDSFTVQIYFVAIFVIDSAAFAVPATNRAGTITARIFASSLFITLMVFL